MASKQLLPGYLNGLQPKEARERYLAKLDYVGGKDPYEIPRSDWLDNVDSWPSVTYIHVGMYLLFKESPYTQDQLMNYKSLQCYRNFENGWVREVLCKEFEDKRLMIAKVNHSQRLSEKPLTPWVICEISGKIIAAYCDCMAGLGESCTSHVASLLWAVEAGAKRRDSLTVTDKKAYWVLPAAVKTVPYARIKDIDFFKATPGPSQQNVPTLSASDLSAFLKAAHKCSYKPAVRSLIAPYSDSYVPSSLKSDLPPLLSELYDRELSTAGFLEILEKAKEKAAKFVSITAEQQCAVERETRDQSLSRLWFRMRTGRITASKYKAAVHTDPATPSQSLIMSICYPETTRFSNEATRWVISHESTARDEYSSQAKEKHRGFKVSECGLIISTDQAFIGASPDGLVTCECCGNGICEIKCPFSHKDDGIQTAIAKDKEFCMESTPTDNYQLKRTHQYYYQVQAQLLCTKKAYCDFVVWSGKELHVERVYRDNQFASNTVPKVEDFFNRGILPELAGKFYSRPPLPTCPVLAKDKFCYCGEGEHGTMVGCDNDACPYQWFHLPCLKLKTLPQTKKWYCPDCQKIKSKRSRIDRQE